VFVLLRALPNIIMLTSLCCVMQADNGADGGYPYWSDQRHQQMPGPPMMTSHQLAATSTLEYRPPPRRAFHGGSMHSVVVPGMMDESALGLLIMLTYCIKLLGDSTRCQ